MCFPFRVAQSETVWAAVSLAFDSQPSLLVVVCVSSQEQYQLSLDTETIVCRTPYIDINWSSVLSGRHCCQWFFIFDIVLCCWFFLLVEKHHFLFVGYWYLPLSRPFSIGLKPDCLSRWCHSQTLRLRECIAVLLADVHCFQSARDLLRCADLAPILMSHSRSALVLRLK